LLDPKNENTKLLRTKFIKIFIDKANLLRMNVE